MAMERRGGYIRRRLPQEPLPDSKERPSLSKERKDAIDEFGTKIIERLVSVVDFDAIAASLDEVARKSGVKQHHINHKAMEDLYFSTNKKTPLGSYAPSENRTYFRSNFVSGRYFRKKLIQYLPSLTPHLTSEAEINKVVNDPKVWRDPISSDSHSRRLGAL